MGHDYCHRHECLCYRGCPDCNPRSEEKAALSAAPSPVTVEGGGNAVPQTLDEIVENSLRMWYFNYDPSLDHTAARIAMREIIKYVIDVARVSPASPSPVDSRDALIERLEDKIEGLEADLDSAVEVAYRRGATEWTRLNYPDHFKRRSEAALSLPEHAEDRKDSE